MPLLPVEFATVVATASVVVSLMLGWVGRAQPAGKPTRVPAENSKTRLSKLRMPLVCVFVGCVCVCVCVGGQLSIQMNPNDYIWRGHFKFSKFECTRG